MRNYVKLIGVVLVDDNGFFRQATVAQDELGYEAIVASLPDGWRALGDEIWIELDKETVWEMASFAFNAGWPQWGGPGTQPPVNDHIKLESPRDSGYNSRREKR